MEVRPGYKLTELGTIPEDWVITRLGAHGETYGGLTGKTKGDFGSGNAHYVAFMDVMSNVVIDRDEFEPVRVAQSESQNRVQRSDLLFNGSSETPEEVAYCGVVLEEFPDLYLNSFCFGYRLRAGSSVDPLFLAYLFRSQTGRELIKALAQGSTRYNISKGALLGAPFAAPHLSEQRAIATALSDADALLGGLDRLIAKKRDLKQAATQRLLTGHTRLPGFHGEWELKQVGHAGRCLRGVSYQGETDLSTHDTNSTKRLLRANNVQNAVVIAEEVQFVDAACVSPLQILRPNDILICMANGSKELVGKAGLFAVDDGYEYTFGAFMGCFRTDVTTANPQFVFYLLQTGQYRNYINNLLAGSSINNLRPSSIESLEFGFPTVPEQRAIAAVISDMDAELAALEARREKTRALKRGMMQELLTGRTRLVPAGDIHA